MEASVLTKQILEKNRQIYVDQIDQILIEKSKECLSTQLSNIKIKWLIPSCFEIEVINDDIVKCPSLDWLRENLHKRGFSTALLNEAGWFGYIHYYLEISSQ